MKNMRKIALVHVLVMISIMLAACGTAAPSNPDSTIVTATSPDPATAIPASPDSGLVAVDINQAITGLPVYDPNAPATSPGAAALRALMALDPSVPDMQTDVEAAERAALNAGIADLQKQLSAGSSSMIPSMATRSGWIKVASPVSVTVSLVSYNRLGAYAAGDNTTHDIALVGALISGLSDIFTPYLKNVGSVNPTHTETEAGVTTTMGLKVARGADGSTTFGIGSQSDATKNGVNVKAGFSGSVDGWRCPNAAGQVSFTIKMSLSGDSGGVTISKDLTAFVRAVVNDNAEITNTQIDFTQATRQVKDGRQVYVESGESFAYNGKDIANGTDTNLRLIRSSSQATLADIRSLVESGNQEAFAMGLTSLYVAQVAWLSGKCTQIEAASPGIVEPSSITAIPVKVVSRFDGSDAPSKLEAVLSGGKSVEPAMLPKTPGTLNYTAPAESGKTATISLTATSRQGRATLDLTATTGEPAYRVNDAQSSGREWVTQCIPALDKPYQLSWKSPEGTGEFQFTPDNAFGGRAKVQLTNSLAGVTITQTGQGTFSISVLSEDAGGAPYELSIDIKATGSLTQCAFGVCTTVNDSAMDQSVPIVVSASKCN